MNYKRHVRNILFCLALTMWFGGCAAGAYYDHNGLTNMGVFCFFFCWILN